MVTAQGQARAVSRAEWSIRALPWGVLALVVLLDLWAAPGGSSPWLHVAVAGTTALLGLVACAAALAGGEQSVRRSAFAVGAATFAAALAVHAVSTPGALIGHNAVVGASGLAAVMLLAGGLALCFVLPHARRSSRGPLVAGGAAATVLLAAAGALAAPHLLAALPTTVPVAMLALFVPASAALVAFGVRARRCLAPADAAGVFPVEFGCSLLGASLLMHYGPAWSFSFWLSHGFELAGAALLAAGTRSMLQQARAVDAPQPRVVPLHAELDEIAPEQEPVVLSPAA